MPDCSSARIKIGGYLSTMEHVLTLAEALEEAGIGHNYNGCLDVSQALRAILMAHQKKRPLDLGATEVSGGQFPELEGACLDLNLAYHRADDGHYTYAPTNEAWRPGMNNPLSLPGNIDDGPAIPLHAVIAALKAGRSLADLAQDYAAFTTPFPPISLAPEVAAQLADDN